MNFRLSTDEFDALRAASDACGSRCLSDFTRAAVLGCARTGMAKAEQIERRIDVLEEKVDTLCGTVLAALARLDLLVERPSGSPGL